MDFTTLIQHWYRQNKRDLPWRQDSDPYQIWLSEIILQQTRIEQGLPYFLKFKQNFPTVKHLAEANENTVLNLWQGLGYYSRARNLRQAAREVVDRHKGKFPETFSEILALKGVGEYTASAVASIAYNLPHAVVDGNVYRVLSRVFQIGDAIDSTAGKKIFAATAYDLLDKNNPGDHNQALMELGALVCTPRAPLCHACPVQVKCLSYTNSSFLNYPVKSKKTKVRNRYFHYLVVTDGKSTVLKKRIGKDIWHGLYDFRLIEKDTASATVKKEIGALNPLSSKRNGSFVHLLSHQKIHATFWLVRVEKLAITKDEVKVKLEKLDDYPMPQLLIRYLEQAGLTERD